MSRKKRKKNSKKTRWTILFSIIAFLYLFERFDGLAFGFIVAIPIIIKYFYARYTAFIKAKSPEQPEIPSPLTETYQSQLSSIRSQHTQSRKSSSSVFKGDIEKITIQLARKFGGRLTPVELSLHTSLSLDEANKALEKFVRKGHADITTTKGGTLLYLFPGLLTVDKKTSPKKQTWKSAQPASHTSSTHESQPAQTLSFSTDELELLLKKQPLSSSQSVNESSLPPIGLELPIEELPVKKSLSMCWVSPGNSVSIHGYIISNGMVYVGNELPSSHRNEPALIDPSLPVPSASIRQLGEPLHYFPAYADIEPENRTNYLSWLSSGRDDQHIDVGYVFLFFYGLERRVLVDIHKIPELQQELPAIITEVKRLLSVYHTNHSFHGYATSFLTFVLAKYHPEQLKVTKDELKDRRAFPFSLKYALAQFAPKGQPVPAPVAFTWFERSPHSTLRTPAKRCRTEFFNLFKIRYHAKFGKGLIIDPHNLHSLSVEYKPANSSLSLGGQTYFYEMDGFPDVSALTEPVSEFQKIVDTCIEDLEPFSRHLGRKSNQKKSRVFALAHLPAELLHATQYPEIKTLRTFIENIVGSQSFVTIDTSDLLTAIKLSLEHEVSRSESELVAQLLGRLGYGIEPDVRFSRHRFTPQKKSVIFKLLEPQTPKASAEYTSASLLLTLSSLIVHADGAVSESEEAHLRSYISTVPSLTPAERQRLDAHLTRLLAEPSSLQSAKKHLRSSAELSKHAIAEFLIALSTADGHVAPEEIDILKKLYAMLELDSESLYSAIHAHQTKDEIALPENFRQGIDSSARGAFEKSGIFLDMKRISHTLQQTEQVHSLLSDVFEETPEAMSFPQKPARHLEVECLPHLDVNHSALFHKLSHLEHISFDDFTLLCKEFDVLSGGAIENLNSAAFEKVDEPLLEEEGDMLIIDREVAKEMSV